MTGKQVRLFLVDGTAGGLMTAEIMNWTGHVLKGKREQLNRIRQRDEAQRTGVYILVGEDNNGSKLAYVGQSDDISKRLLNHDAKKEFWQEAVLITSKDTNLTSAHVRFLEAQLIELAQNIGRVPLENGNNPTGGADLPEADRSDMNYFIEQLRILLPVLGVDMFRGRDTRDNSQTTNEVRQQLPETTAGDSPVFYLRRTKLGIEAKAQIIDGEFTMLAGSVIVPAMRDSKRTLSPTTQRAFDARKAILEQITQDGALDINDGRGVLTRDVVFTSPSAAGAIALGQASLNGRIEWATANGQSFDSWETSITSTPEGHTTGKRLIRDVWRHESATYRFGPHFLASLCSSRYYRRGAVTDRGDHLRRSLGSPCQ